MRGASAILVSIGDDYRGVFRGATSPLPVVWNVDVDANITGITAGAKLKISRPCPVR